MDKEIDATTEEQREYFNLRFKMLEEKIDIAINRIGRIEDNMVTRAGFWFATTLIVGLLGVIIVILLTK